MKIDRRVNQYIARSQAFARPILEHLRALVHAGCPEVEEDIKWGMPSFIYRGKILCAMAAFKAHATFGFWHKGMEKILQRELGVTAQAMGLFGRLTSVKDLPADRRMLGYIKAATELEDSGAPRQAPRKKKPELPTPPDLAAGLRKDRKAGAHWADFAPGQRREYLEWITAAKRPETRATRLATTLEWVAQGKRRHWKYQDC